MRATSSGPGRDLLAEIVAVKRAEVVERRRKIPEAELERWAETRVHRAFEESLRRPGRAVIAEMKKASPSRGLMRQDYRPAEIARVYEAAGARALSVLTDDRYFQGSLAHLTEARQAVSLPVLRKDFIVDGYQVAEAAAAGADVILLIVAALDQPVLAALLHRSAELGLEALVEVHNEQELRRASAAGARMIGVNNRNLATLSVDLQTSLRLRPLMPEGVVAVSESGLKTAADLDRLEAAGYRAFLIGEHFMTSPDPGEALTSFLAGATGSD